MLASNAPGMISAIKKYLPLLYSSSLIGLGVCGATVHMIRTILHIASHKLSMSCISVEDSLMRG